jgi:hypothetical protein
METPVAAVAAPVVPPAVVAAPVPLTAVPEVPAEAPRTKRKYTKRAVTAAPKGKRKNAKKEVKAKAPKAAKKAKAEKKPKRVAGTKAQGQVSKGCMRFLKNLAKEKDETVGALVGVAVERYAKSQGYDPEA